MSAIEIIILSSEKKWRSVFQHVHKRALVFNSDTENFNGSVNVRGKIMYGRIFANTNFWLNTNFLLIRRRGSTKRVYLRFLSHLNPK